jgi:hypothetical protein
MLDLTIVSVLVMLGGKNYVPSEYSVIQGTSPWVWELRSEQM